MNQFSLTTRLALNEFRVSCYSYHMSQSALGETNWLLRVLGCNLTLNSYLIIQMGHHHGHPLTGAMELRPDHWSTTLGISPRDPKDLRTDPDQTFLINQTDSVCIHTNIYTYTSHTISHNSPLSYSQPNHANSLFSNPEYGALSHTITMPHWYQPFHISCRTHTKVIISISWLIQLSCPPHVKTHKSQLIHHLIHKGHSVHKLKWILIQACCQLLKSRKTSIPTTFSPSISLRQKGLAQARRTLAQASSLRLGESSTSSIRTMHAFLLRRDPLRLGDHSWQNT